MLFTKLAMKSWAHEPRLLLALLVSFFTVGFTAQSLSADSRIQSDSSVLLNQLITLDPHSETNLNRLGEIAERLGKNAKKESKAEKKLARRTEDLKNLPTAELRRLFMETSSKYQPRAVSIIGRLAREALLSNAPTRSARETDIMEVQASLRAERNPPVPDKLGFFTTWIFFFKNLSGKIGQGDTVATNLAQSNNLTFDSSLSDPLPSTFWRRPSAIDNQNLYAGFGRSDFPHLEKTICEYSGPKVSSGTHAGFDVECDGVRYKVKFGEINSEPFTARIFFALGYHVDPTDFAPEIRVRYNRRLLREFHLRKPLNMKITPFGVHVGTIRLQTHYDPFSFITRAVFQDGRKVSGSQLKQMLFKNSRMSHPEESPENFRPEVEADLDYLEMAPVNVQLRDEPTQSIGSWEFGGLGHENRRELRGLGLLAAWLSWFDSRTDNNRLRIERDSDGKHLEYFISDLGGGMGAGSGWFSPHGENPNDLTWTFTAPEIVRGPGRMTTPFRIEHFTPSVPTPSFAAMTVDDARWMARLIGQLTENQLRSALIGAGYDNAEAMLYLEKLISRRDRMIRDLKLENEIPLLRPNGQNHRFNYNPATDGPFEASVNGKKISARQSAAIISRGELVNGRTAGQLPLN